MELQTLIDKATKDYIGSDEFKENIAKKAQSMVDNTIDGIFRSYSPLSKQLEETVNKALEFNVKELGMGGYKKLVIQQIELALDAKFSKDVSEKLTVEIEELLSTAPNIVTVEMLKTKLFKDADVGSCGDMSYSDIYDREEYEDDYFTFTVELNDENDWYELYLDKEPNKSQHDCKYKLTIFSSGGIYIRDNGEDLKKQMLSNSYRNSFSKFLYQMHLQDSKMDMDSLSEIL